MQYSGAVRLGVERSAVLELMLSLMPMCPFYDKVVLAVVGCYGVGALLHSMYSVVALRLEVLCLLTSLGQGMCLWSRELHLQPVNRSVVVTFACPRSGLYQPPIMELCNH